MASRLPAKTDKPTPENIKILNEGLTSVIAGHAQAIEAYTFYEVLDDYLGPWGKSGYPIGYGKFYNIAFMTNEKLMSNPTTRGWVWDTTILLQEMLRDYVVMRFKVGSLAHLTEADLRDYAFNTHPQAYTKGGLAIVVIVAPELVPIIIIIPGVEFRPSSDNFGATIVQVLVTTLQMAPQMAGMGLASMAGPAHTGILSRAVRMDQNRMLREQGMMVQLEKLKRAIQSGKVDDVTQLNEITTRLNATQYPDQGFARFARDVVALANERKRYIANYYRSLLKDRPNLRSQLDKYQPGWSNW